MPDINLRVQIDGVDDLMKGLQRVFTNLAPIMADAEKRIAERLKRYPPPPPNSSYDRTGDLGRGWEVSVDALGTNLYQDRISVELRNDVESPSGQHYAGWVQGPDTQTERHHQTGWETTQQVVDAETPMLLDDIASAIHRGWTQ